MRSNARSRSRRASPSARPPIPESRRIAFRIGINVGDIIVEDGDILGDGVNVAARLEGLAEPGGICIARNVHDQVKAKLDHEFEPQGEHKVKNIAEPVSVYRVGLGPGGAVRRRPAAIAWALRGHRQAAIAAAVVALLAAGAAAGWYALWRPGAPPPAVAGSGAAQAKPALPLPNKPSIVVLPFSNLSGAADQEYFADAVTEDITTGLAQFRDLFVISGNSSFTYKGQAVDVKQVGARAWRSLRSRRQCPALGRSAARDHPADRCHDRRAICGPRPMTGSLPPPTSSKSKIPSPGRSSQSWVAFMASCMRAPRIGLNAKILIAWRHMICMS